MTKRILKVEVEMNESTCGICMFMEDTHCMLFDRDLYVDEDNSTRCDDCKKAPWQDVEDDDVWRG